MFDETIEEKIARFKAQDELNPPMYPALFPGDSGWPDIKNFIPSDVKHKDKTR